MTFTCMVFQYHSSRAVSLVYCLKLTFYNFNVYPPHQTREQQRHLNSFHPSSLTPLLQIFVARSLTLQHLLIEKDKINTNTKINLLSLSYELQWY